MAKWLRPAKIAAKFSRLRHGEHVATNADAFTHSLINANTIAAAELNSPIIAANKTANIANVDGGLPHD